jgi:hypothetical protein
MACAAQGPLGETGDYRSRIIRVLAGPGGGSVPGVWFTCLGELDNLGT